MSEQTKEKGEYIMKLDTNRVNEVMYIQISLSYMCIYEVSKRYEMFLRDLHIYENFLNCLLCAIVRHVGVYEIKFKAFSPVYNFIVLCSM